MHTASARLCSVCVCVYRSDNGPSVLTEEVVGGYSKCFVLNKVIFIGINNPPQMTNIAFLSLSLSLSLSHLSLFPLLPVPL